MSKEYISLLEKQLVKAGYNLYDDTLYNSEGEYQKEISDDEGVKYAINFYKYEWENSKGNVIGCTWEVRVRFILSISKMDMLFSQFKDESKLLDIEYFIEQLFERLDAHHYEKEE